MTRDEALADINRELAIDGVPTVNGLEIKCWVSDGGAARRKTYLNAYDCRNLAAAFTALAASLSPTALARDGEVKP